MSIIKINNYLNRLSYWKIININLYKLIHIYIKKIKINIVLSIIINKKNIQELRLFSFSKSFIIFN